ncbi:MAG: Asp/Glu racemase [Rhodobacteraceae bacterium]|nr:MAG: Asp/Glu racemase [Paracoccaceae bacterium]
MNDLPYDLDVDDPTAPPLGLIVLQADETIEPEFKAYFADRRGPLYVTRIPSGATVTRVSLAAMETDLMASADLLPKARSYPVVGYGCTSASSVIGSEKVEELVQRTCAAKVVTNPLRAALAWAGASGVSRLALISPYIEEVNEPLRRAFAEGGITTDVFGTFNQAEEEKVVRISRASVVDAAVRLGSDPAVDGVFLSCTNLRTIDAIPEIEKRLSKPVMSSNRALAWHMKRLEATNSGV